MTEPSVASAVESDQPFNALSGEQVADAPGIAGVASAATQSLFSEAAKAAKDHRIDLLNNVEMEVTAELGRTRMTVRELLALTPGVVVELDKSAGSPIDLYVNGTLIAHGEVVVIDEEFGVRISAIVGPDATETI